MSDPDSHPAFMTFQSKEPSTSFRFVPPHTPPPFEARSLVLKQTDTQRLDETGRHAMTLFSSFFDRWRLNKDRDIEDAKAMLGSLTTKGSEYEVRTDTHVNRRLSGDGSLSSSRYHTVCESQNGSDGGTMERELLAYHDPLTNGIIDIQDVTDRLAAGDSLPVSLEPDAADGLKSAVLLSIPPFTASQHEWMQDAARRWETTYILLPVTVTEATFRRLIDLRVPSVAEWFTRNLTRLRWLAGDGSEALAFPNKPTLDHFGDLLPSLAAQTLGGGNGAARIAGQWLRSLGADAVVFPSARSDSFVEVRDGDVSAFHGWNVVDYRAAQPVRLQTCDLTPNWIQSVSNEIDEQPFPIYADVALQVNRQRRGNGSWSWQKLEQANSAKRSLASALHLYAWARGDASAEQLQQLAAMLGNTDGAEVLGPMADYFVEGLLGSLKARHALLESVSVGLGNEEASLVDLLDTFRRMDTRIAALRPRGIAADVQGAVT